MDDAPFRQAFAAFGKSGSVGSVEAETGGEQTSLLGSLRERVSGWGPSAAPREAELLGLTWTQRLAGGVLCAGLAAMCFVLAFMSLITAVVNPARVATPYSLGSLFLIASMALFRGPRLFIRSALARDRLLFTLAYLLSIVVTLILAFSSSLILRILSAVFMVVQIFTLSYYLKSYLPGGGFTGLSLMGRTMLPV